MPTVKSLDDLKRLREEALEKRKMKTSDGKAQVIVGMGTLWVRSLWWRDGVMWWKDHSTLCVDSLHGGVEERRPQARTSMLSYA